MGTENFSASYENAEEAISELLKVFRPEHLQLSSNGDIYICSRKVYTLVNGITAAAYPFGGESSREYFLEMYRTLANFGYTELLGREGFPKYITRKNFESLKQKLALCHDFGFAAGDIVAPTWLSAHVHPRRLERTLRDGNSRRKHHLALEKGRIRYKQKSLLGNVGLPGIGAEA
jgi:hypothetical protein